MHGDGLCPFRRYNSICRKEKCELWDYDQECAINLIVRLLRKIEGERKE